MTKILYAGHAVSVPDAVKVDELASAIQNIHNSGKYSYLTIDLTGEEPKRIRLLFGPGIPVGIVSDQMDGHTPDLSDESLSAFLDPEEDPAP